MENSCKARSVNRTIILVFGAIMMLFNGLIYAWSIFVTPLEQEFGWNREQTSLVFTLSMSISILGQIVGGIFVSKKRQGLILRIASLMLAAGFVWASMINSLAALYISYGVICGFAVGISYNTVLAIVSTHFEENAGFALGVLLMAFGLGNLVLGSLTTSLILASGWRIAFRVLALCFSVLMFSGSFIMIPARQTAAKSKTSPGKPQTSAMPDTTPKEMVSMTSFWRFFVWAMLMSSTGLLIIGHAATYAADLGASLRIASLSAGFISIFNGMSRPLFGHYYDKNGNVKTMTAIGLIYILAIAGLFASCFMNNLYLLFISYGILGIAYGGGPIVISSYVKDNFGGKYYGTNLGITNMNIALASFVGPFIAGVLRTRWNSYLPAFIMMLVFVIVSMLLIPRNRKA